jgi:hypothetical protein
MPNTQSSQGLNVLRLVVRTFLRCLIEWLLQSDKRFDLPTGSFEAKEPGHIERRIYHDLSETVYEDIELTCEDKGTISDLS